MNWFNPPDHWWSTIFFLDLWWIALAIVLLLAVAARYFRRRQIGNGVRVEGSRLLLTEDGRPTVMQLDAVIRIEAISMDRLGYETWGVQLSTRNEAHYLDEDIHGFAEALAALAIRFGFDAEDVIVFANAELIKKPFKGFRRVLWSR